MHIRSTLRLAAFGLGVAAQSTAGPYGQCGGIGYSGPSACGAGYTCTSYNAYYYQCYPGGPTVPPTSSSVSPSTSAHVTSTTDRSTTSSSRAGTTSQPGTSTTLSRVTTTASGGSGSVPTTLLPGWYWIRGVESPYFHSYLQSQPTGTPGIALLSANTGAGQFNIIDGQLVYNTGGSELYMNVEDPADKTQRALHTYFNATQNTYGTFAFSGDTVTWMDPDVNRPNTAAFYVCGDDELYINTGAYLYLTPDGCYDVDIHSYGGSTANV